MAIKAEYLGQECRLENGVWSCPKVPDIAKILDGLTFSRRVESGFDAGYHGDVDTDLAELLVNEFSFKIVSRDPIPDLPEGVTP